MSIKKSVDGLVIEHADLQGNIAQLRISDSEILAELSRVEKSNSESVKSVNGTVETLRKEVSSKLTPDEAELVFRTVLENGVEKVVTSTGFTFNENGLTVEKSGSEMKTQITENGMVVSQNGQDVLTANNNGVEARNLHASTYLTVGGRSRFENYGNNRTGCFWIGG